MLRYLRTSRQLDVVIINSLMQLIITVIKIDYFQRSKKLICSSQKVGTGFEPATYEYLIRCSNPLSYPMIGVKNNNSIKPVFY